MHRISRVKNDDGGENEEDREKEIELQMMIRGLETNEGAFNRKELKGRRERIKVVIRDKV